MPAERPRPRHSIAKPVAKPATNTRNAEGRKKRTNVNIMPPEETKRAIDKLLSNEKAVEYLKRNVSKAAIDVVCTLVTPKTDEQLVEQLGMKINAIRRILNIMQGYGITNYYISKNTKGWLSFAWYINTGKLRPFLDYVANTESEKTITNSNCNDYFLCDNCYKTDKLLYTFDAAFESSFRCPCGKSLARMDKEEAETIINTNSAI
jgi:transcription initiation factor IIE alpha subunit